MRRLVLRVTVLMIAFGVGLGVNQIFSRRPTPQATPVQISAAPQPLPVFETIYATPPTPPAAIEPPNAAMDYDPDKFYPDGGYTVVGELPKQFRQFKFFSVELTAPVDGLSGYIHIATGAQEPHEWQKAVFGLVTKKRVFWVSQRTADGFEYRFDGEFLSTNFGKLANTSIPVLRGTLTKTRKGRKVAAAVVSFSIDYPSC